MTVEELVRLATELKEDRKLAVERVAELDAVMAFLLRKAENIQRMHGMEDNSELAALLEIRADA